MGRGWDKAESGAGRLCDEGKPELSPKAGGAGHNSPSSPLRRRRFDGKRMGAPELRRCCPRAALIAFATASCCDCPFLIAASACNTRAFACGFKIHASEQKDQRPRHAAPRSHGPFCTHAM